MRHRTESDFKGRSQLPTAAANVTDDLADALDQRGGAPRLISIGYSEDSEVIFLRFGGYAGLANYALLGTFGREIPEG